MTHVDTYADPKRRPSIAAVARGIWRRAFFRRPRRGFYPDRRRRPAVAPPRRLTHTASVCDTPQARHSNVARSGKPSNRGVRLASRIGCAQLGQRGGETVEFGVLVSHMVVAPGRNPQRSLRAELETGAALLGAARAVSSLADIRGRGGLTARGCAIKLWQSHGETGRTCRTKLRFRCCERRPTPRSRQLSSARWNFRGAGARERTSHVFVIFQPPKLPVFSS